MIKSLLVPATGSAGDDAAFGAAITLARTFGAHLDFLHVRVDPAAVAVAMTSETGAAAMISGLIERIEADADERERLARERFDAFCRRESLAFADAPSAAGGLSAAWHCETGEDAFWIAEYGRAADLLVLGRPDNGDGIGREALEAALLDSGRPVLLAPKAGLARLPETIAIAWKPAREAALAVAAATAFFSLVKEVQVLTVDEDDTEAQDAAERLAAGLRWHGVAVVVRRLDPAPEGVGDALLKAAGDTKALLVMGGYGHSRMREWVFGGVTARVLSDAAVPVLMAH